MAKTNDKRPHRQLVPRPTGTAPHHLGKGDVLEISEGTIIASAASLIIYMVHQNWEIPVEVEGAMLVLIYAALRLASRWIRDTRPIETEG